MSGPIRSEGKRGEVAESDAPLLDSITGREDDLGAEPGNIAEDDIRQPIGARPKSETTARHDGTGEDETIDGLDETQEALRHGAEDIPIGGSDPDDVPVFDRGDGLPKLPKG